MKKVLLLLLSAVLCLVGCGKSVPTVVDYELDIPEDFEESTMENADAYYYNEDGSNIIISVMDRDPAFKSATIDQFHAAIEEEFSNYGLEVSITDNYFKQDDFEGIPSYQYSISYDLMGVSVNQIVIGVNADKLYTFTFTDMSNSWIEIYEKCIDSLHFITE